MTKHDDITSLKNKYFDSDQKSVTNLYLGVYEPDCEDILLKSAQFVGIQRLAGGNVVASAMIPKSKYPFKTNACAQVFYYPIQSLFESPSINTTNLEVKSFTAWSTERTKVHITIINDFDYDIDLFWSDESNEGLSQGILSPGNTQPITTYLGHTFLAYRLSSSSPSLSPSSSSSSDERGEIVDFFVVNGADYHLSPVNRIETCDSSIEGSFVPTKLDCNDMQGRYTEFSHQVWYQKRLGLNYVQPQLVHAVTSNGFQLLRMPVETYSWLRAWYDSKRESAVFEGSGGPCMNQHVAPAEVAHLPSHMKDRLAEELKPILREWYGGDLFMTSIYGVRKYTNGSVLRMHVDTVGTHVVSAIINVDQSVEEDWKLLILDHEDNEHRVIMQPGDMLLYESAKLLHGRPETFKGSHYDNIFIHYKPYTGWDYNWI